MSEAVRAMGGSTDGTTAPGPPDAAGQPARGRQVQSPSAGALGKQKQQQQEQQQVQSPSSAAAAEADAEQAKYHQQMLYPTPGLRNYGFETDFMLYRFKVEPCKRQEKHARGSCPFAHPGDVAQRRPPDAYQALLCPEVRAKKVCPRGNECQCSHSAFEFWLHPDRYRTSMCEKGERCSRPVCFFAHNQKELRALPAGLKPAPQNPETEHAKRHAASRAGSVSGMAQSPRELVGFPAGMQGAPAFAAEGVAAMYVQGSSGRQYQMQQQQRRHPMAAGYAPVAGYMQAGAGYSQPAPAGYRVMQAPPALDVTMQGQYSAASVPGQYAGMQYMPTSPMLSPTGRLQPQEIVGSPLLVAGGASAGGQQFSPVGVRGSQSSGGASSAGGVWPQQQQQQQGGPQAAAAAATTPSGGGMPLAESVVQQFQQLDVGGAAAAAAAGGPVYAADPSQAGMIMPAMQAPYPQQQVVYMQPGPEAVWAQQQQQQQRQQQAVQQYGLQQYGSPAMDTQGTQQAVQPQMMAVMLQPAQVAAQQQYAMQGDAQAQAWGAGRMVLQAADPNTLMQGQPGGPSYSGQGGW